MAQTDGRVAHSLRLRGKPIWQHAIVVVKERN
jgi:hypothetical protein